MKRPRSKIPFLSAWAVLLVSLGACETIVDVTPPSHAPQLVAQSFFTLDSLWVVRVTNTVGYTSPEKPGFVEDATVEIWQDGQRRAQLARSDSGTYVVTGPGPSMGAPYTLRVSAPGFPAIAGSDALPIPPPVHTFRETVLQPGDGTEAGSRRRVTQVEITLDDPPEIDNFYGLLVVQARWSEDRRTGQRRLLAPSLFPFESDDLALGESEFDFLNTDKTLYREAFFTDGLFNGSAYTLDFDLQYDTPRPEADVVIQRVFGVLLLSVTEDFFRYWKTAGRQAITNENPFAEPLRVHSNMSGGLGVFAGFQYRLFPIGVDSLTVAGYGIGDLCSLSGISLPLCNAGPSVR